MTGISAINGYPMGLGNLGLPSLGAYGSYDYNMPMSMMNYGMNGMNGMGMGMMGMYSPTFMAQMMGAQQQIEQSQMAHTANMHQGMLDNEVRAVRETDKALIDKILTNSSVQHDIQNLRSAVVSGNLDGTCVAFNKLRNQILETYKDEIKGRGLEENPIKAANEIIDKLYGQVISMQTGQMVSLRDDIVKYGESAIRCGFMQGLKPGHSTKYTDEVLNYCYGEEIDHRKSQDTAQKVGHVVGRGVLGAGVGAGVAGLGLGLINCLTPSKVKAPGSNAGWVKQQWYNLMNSNFVRNSHTAKGWFNGIKKVGKWGFLAACAADIVWQLQKA